MYMKYLHVGIYCMYDYLFMVNMYMKYLHVGIYV